MVTLLKRHRPRVNSWPGSLVLISSIHLKNRKQSVPVVGTLKDTITRNPWRSHRKYWANFKKQKAEITKLQCTRMMGNTVVLVFKHMPRTFLKDRFWKRCQGTLWDTGSVSSDYDYVSMTMRHWFCVKSGREVYPHTHTTPTTILWFLCHCHSPWHKSRVLELRVLPIGHSSLGQAGIAVFL